MHLEKVSGPDGVSLYAVVDIQIQGPEARISEN